MRSRLVTDEAQACFISHATHDTRPVRAPILRATLMQRSAWKGYSPKFGTHLCMRKKMFSLPLMLVGLWWKGLTRRDLLGGRKEERHVRAGNHDTGCSGQDGRRQGPHPGADPIPTAADGRVQGVRRPGRSEQRQAYRRVLLGERGSLAGYRRSGP